MAEHTTTHPCEASGGCGAPATIDFGKHVRVPGIPGEVRFLCCHHATGTRAHFRRCPIHAAPKAAR